MVGVVDVLPKLMARRLLDPALQLDENLRLVCVEASLEELLSSLMLHKLDIVLSDTPVTAAVKVRAYNHLLGDTAVGMFATAKLAERYRKDFPKSLNGAPLLLPGRSSALRRSLDSWLDRNEIHPRVRAEFDDTALMKSFGQSGEGIFPGGLAISNEICRQYQVECIGNVEGIREQFFAISAERRIKHPAVLSITNTARADIFI
jgi:LysR family transcriptional regulator, transcriptional activator of nhaA